MRLHVAGPSRTNRWSHRSHYQSSAFSSRYNICTGHRGGPSPDGTIIDRTTAFRKLSGGIAEKGDPSRIRLSVCLRGSLCGTSTSPSERCANFCAYRDGVESPANFATEAARGPAFCVLYHASRSPSPGAAVVGNRHLAMGFRPIQKIATIHASSGLAGVYGTGTNNREVSRESSRDQFGCWRCALRRHVSTGIGDAHEQSRLRSERSHAGPKRALCVQSVRVPVATELLSPLRLRLSLVLRLWTRLLRLWSKLLRLRTKLPVLPLN